MGDQSSCDCLNKINKIGLAIKRSLQWVMIKDAVINSIQQMNKTKSV